jgi:hypothetical protein
LAPLSARRSPHVIPPEAIFIAVANVKQSPGAIVNVGSPPLLELEVAPVELVVPLVLALDVLEVCSLEVADDELGEPPVPVVSDELLQAIAPSRGTPSTTTWSENRSSIFMERVYHAYVSLGPGTRP